MGRVKFIHSFNTKPLFINTYGVDFGKKLLGNILYYALSVAYVKRSGGDIELHTDSLGASLLSCIPYDNVWLTLDSLPYPDLSPRFWAAGKIWALEASGVGAIHIDGDVFIKKSSLIEDIENSDWDFICQCYEPGDWYSKERDMFQKHLELCRNIDLTFDGGYNTGVMGFRKQDILDKFIDGYKYMSIEFSKLEKENLSENSYKTPDLITEQQQIYQICKNNKSKVKTLLNYPNLTPDAIEIGYQHVYTHTKFSYLEKCSEVLKKVSPSIYKNVIKVCPSYLLK